MVFLDTSVQIQRTLDDSPQSEQLNALLHTPTIQPITSSYVWMEYQRAVVADFAHVYQVMLRYQDWGGLFAHVLDGERAFRPRSAVRCTKIIGKFYIESNRNWEIAQHTIAEQIRSGLHQQFWMNVSPLSDPIVCDLVKLGVTRQSDRTYQVPASCRKEEATCYLPSFLDTHQERLRAVADYLATHLHTIKEQSRFERLLSAVIGDPRAALGQTSCSPLGDLIIALQVPPNAMLWTLDADFAPLAAALTIPLYTLES
ncbi:MAG: hypothetical protein DYG89_20150 [Caldilinea sp. CFX5]|nr:hypothetical protein [Caldilinea sp. CFX5]